VTPPDDPDPANTSDPSTSAAGPGRVTDALVGVLDLLVPTARRVRLAVTVLAAASATWVVLLFVALPLTDRVRTTTGWFAHLVLIAILLGPPVLLFGLRFLLSSVVNLPDRLRREPGLRAEQVNHLASLAAGDDPRTDEQELGVRERTWRLGRLLLEARGQLVAYSVLWRLVSVPYLVLCAFAAAIAVVELVLLPVIVVALLLTW